MEGEPERKIRRLKEPVSSSNGKEKTSHVLESIRDDVYLVRNGLTEQQVDVLCRECDLLRANYAKDDPLDRGAALDPFEYHGLSTTNSARTDSARYLIERASAVKAAPDSPENNINAVKDILFTHLPTLLREILHNLDIQKEGAMLYLFNEHYVVKEGKTEFAFRWHRDADEQMPFACPSTRTVYLSCWCALDDVYVDNGTLIMQQTGTVYEQKDRESSFEQIMSFDDKEEDASIEPEETQHGWPVIARAGDVVVFSSEKWHCSGMNESDAVRRVFYAQYSGSPIATGAQREVLSLAVPCEIAVPHTHSLSSL